MTLENIEVTKDGIFDIFDIASKFKKNNESNSIVPLTSTTSELNRELVNTLSTIQQLGWSMDDEELMARVHDFVSQIENHPFKIVICGEMKNGKSSIFNAVLGEKASRVKGSFPTTGAILKLQYSKRPDFKGQWMTSEQAKRIEDSLKKDSNGVSERDLLEKVQLIKTSGIYNPGGEINNIRSTDDLENYISIQGKYTHLVKEITFTSKIPLLKNGAILIDTPGLNDSILVRNEFSIEESLSADCVIFTLNASALNKATDKFYLKELLDSGRTVNMIIVVTHIDRIETDEEVDEVLTQAKNWVQGVVEYSPNIKLLGPIGINAKLAMELSTQGKYKIDSDKSGLSKLISAIQDVLSDDTNNKRYRENSKQQFNKLKDFTKVRCAEFFEKVNQQMPSEQVLSLLDKNCLAIANISEELIVSVQKRLDAVNTDCRTFMQSIEEQFEEAKNAAVTDLSNEVRRLVESFGDTGYADKKNWETFDELIVPKIANKHFSPVKGRFENKIDTWKKDLESFSEENRDDISKKIPLIMDGAEDLSKVCSQNSRLIHVSSMINKSMKDGEKLAAGLLGGHMLTGGTAALASAGLSVVGTIGLPITLTGFGIVAFGYAMLRKVSSIKNNKEKYINQKVESFKTALDTKTESIANDLRTTENEIRNVFLTSAENQYSPIIKQSMMLTLYNKLYLGAIKASQDSADKFHGKIDEQFNQINSINI